MKTIVLTGGGTAGHIIPNLALLPELKKYFDNIYYIGCGEKDAAIVKPYNIPFFSIPAVKLARGKIITNLKIPFIMINAIKKAEKILRELSPNIVFSKGGFVALPVCYAAKLLGVPVVTHESDISLGVANKLISSFAEKTITSFPETKGGVFLGNPIREEFLVKNQFHDTSDRRKRILITGGSSGSAAINEVVYKCLDELTKNYDIIHIAGNNFKKSYPNSAYTQFSYTNSICDLMKKSDLIICRSGSNTLNEVACLGKPCITIPLPKGASRGDQILNAESFCRRGYCDVIYQEDLTSTTLMNHIKNAFDMIPPATGIQNVNKKIVELIIDVAK